MRAADQGSFLNRISIRRNQVMEHDQELEDLELFQRNTADRFQELLAAPPQPLSGASAATPKKADDLAGTPDQHNPSESPVFSSDQFVPPPLMSIEWYRRLLDVFLCCEAEFKAVLVMDRDPMQLNKPPLDKLIPDLLDRAIKALDICNAVTHGVELVRHWQRLAQIAVAALEQRPIGEGQVRRAKKALSTLLTSMTLDDNQNAAIPGKTAERTWSFGRRGGNVSMANKDRTGGTFRSLSWSMAKSWSAAKQIQTMSSNLVAPRGVEANGLPMTVYIMSTVLVFVMWAFVAAFPCQERNGLAAHLPVPRQLGWAQAMTVLQEKIGEEWKKKEKKGTAGLLEETQRMEKVSQGLIDFADSFQFPLEEDKVEEAAALVAELSEICRKMEEGLAPLQQQVREVFHRMVRSRAEVLDVIDQAGKMSAPVPY